MSPIAWLFVALIVVPIAGMAWSFISIDRAGLATVRANLNRSSGRLQQSGPEAQRIPFKELGVRFTPKGYVGWLDKLLARAGRPAGMPLERLLIAKPALALVAGLLGLYFFLRAPSGPGFLLYLFVVALCYMVPDVMIHSRGAKRQDAIQLELPNTLDQMLISVEAGLGFEAAMSRAGQNGSGPLASEFLRTLQDMQAGRSRKEAYLALANRADVPELRSFVRAVVQADTYGIAIASVLRIQASQMRVKRRQRAEEKAMKLPIKVLFPLMLCILPVLFIVIMGPAAINVMNNFVGAF
ncbi:MULTISPECIES: type II secretion system F family protein [Arthrobacter]|uniref:Type II secretion system F family protein n=1 Tax=Arthrobacter terricola TaxID=2547396 RepID=A0A4R5L0D6_9MICC|nr:MULTISPECIES: type II secretion system F family protein [Arthrobacter]MBT8159003.1 type II secretion system F family protein [Arthrobacter sp. GN70]TDG01671.1 type II secretion system F family protein [Arthrobacter terricola]